MAAGSWARAAGERRADSAFCVRSRLKQANMTASTTTSGSLKTSPLNLRRISSKVADVAECRHPRMSTIDDFCICRRSLTLLHCRCTLTFRVDKVMRIRTPTDLGAVIRDRRIKLQLDQKSLAVKAGVSRQWIVEVEKGKPGAEIGLVLRTIEALGINLAVDEPRSQHQRPLRRVRGLQRSALSPA